MWCNLVALFFWFFGPAFGSGADNPHLPHNHERNQFVYTGTHDNDTVKFLHAMDFFQSGARFVFLVRGAMDFFQSVARFVFLVRGMTENIK